MYDKLFIQKIYADQVGSRLELFRVQSHSPYKANFRCPICGDSAKNHFKRRGYFLEMGNNLLFSCHNQCGNLNFENFLKDNYSDLYAMYKFDLIKAYKSENQTTYKAEEIKEVEPQVDSSIDLPLVSTNEKALSYLLNRKIPDEYLQDMYYTDKFYKFIWDLVPDKFPETYNDHTEERIILPLRGFDKNIFGIVARALDPRSNTKYYTIRFNEGLPKIFGMDRLNRSLFSYVVEGPIDSFFIDNCVALAGTDGRPDDIFSSKNDYCIILDNQPRAPDVLRKYLKYIDNGCKIVIWPKDIEEKDINEMILAGRSNLQINNIIKANTFQGLRARIMFNDWKRI